MNRWILGTAALALVGVGCSHGSASQASASSAQPAPTQEQAQGAMASRMAAMCPMTVPGTQVSAADTETGEALAFSTSSPDQVSELRTRVHAMADMHNQRHSGDTGAAGATGQGGMGAEQGTGMGGDTSGMHMPPPSTATVEDTDTGARLVVTPKDPTQLAQLQSTVRSHAEMMQQQGSCGMMGGMQHPGSMQEP